MLGLGLSLTTGGVATPAYVALAKAFVTRVEADGGTVESFACLKTDMAYLTSNPAAPAGYTAEWSAATVGSSAEFRINLVGGAGYTYTYAVTDSQATEVTGTGVMGGNIQAVTADLSTLVDGTVTLAVYLTGAGGDGLVVTDTATLVGYTGLLDTYSGAAAAYSLRLLDTSYTGDAIVVRRASDNTTQNIGFVNNELDTATLESFCSGTDGFVATWYDQSGNGYDMAQASASSQPKIVSGGSTILENTKPAFQFNGSNSFLSIPQSNATGTNPLNVNGDLLFSMVLRSLTNTSAYIFNNYQGSSGIYTGNHTLWHQDPSGSGVTYEASYDDNSSPATLVSATETLTQKLLTNIRDKGSTDYIYINGTSSASTTDTTTGDVLSNQDWVLGKRSISDGEFFNGNIQEIVLYASDQSTNRTGIETNINSHYNIYP